MEFQFQFCVIKATKPVGLMIVLKLQWCELRLVVTYEFFWGGSESVSKGAYEIQYHPKNKYC